ncbi:fibronectin type III domain-containing protein [Flavobacterium sp. CS20]|uniref:fibronectin type III domain-containing protein n=1 Tax=Flavobacterium sp. CS20 TaxID=2775246 RepID=UPI001B3A1E6C|nr:fibronectin type III domain-containing protein [Flavobacterium sp. CS20]QTY27994.1 fibronectin type III domain-containing protein [Flavobacterium sp. CS20]
MKQITLLLMFFFILPFLGQAQNEDCSGALTASVTPFGDVSQPINFDTTGAQDASVVPSCEGFDSSESDLWYTFTTNATDGVTLSLLSGDEGDIEGAIYDACGGTELFCFADGSSVDFTSDVLVTGLTANTTYFLQVYTEDYSEGAFSLAITDLPACAEPQNLNVTNITTDSADLNWDDVTNATNGFEWFVFASGDDPLTAIPVATGTVVAGITTVNVTGLTSQTDYDFYVSSDCATDGTSVLSGPEPFTTLAFPPANDECSTAIALTVNSDLNCASVTNGTTAGATASSQTDDVTGTPDNDVWFSFVATQEQHQVSLENVQAVIGTSIDMGMGLYDGTSGCSALSLVDDSDPNTLSANGLTIGSTYLVRVYGWSSSNTAQTTFDVCVGTPPPPPSNDDCTGALPLTVTTDNTTFTTFSTDFATEGTNELNDCDASGNLGVWYTFTAPSSTIEFLQGASGDPGITIYEGSDCNNLTELTANCVNNNDGILTGLTVGNTYYAMVWTDSTQTTAEFVLFFNECPAPSGLTAENITSSTADLTWTAGNSETEWEVLWGLEGFDPTNEGTVVNDNDGTLGISLQSLSPNTSYDFYVTAVCASGNSDQAGPASFTTPCDVFTPDYLEDFTNFVPDCWDEATDGDPTTGPTGLGSGSWTSDGFLNDGSSGSARINLYSTFKSDWLLSPSFDLSAGGFEVAFNIGITTYSGTSNSPMGSDDEVQLLYSDDNGATWNNLQTWARGSEPSNAGELVTVDLSSITGTSVQFAFWGTEGTVDDAEDYNIYIDNFEVRTPPSCAAPTGLTASNVTATSVQLDWTATTSTETGGYEYVLITDGSTPDATTTPTGSVGTGVTTANPTGLTPRTDYEAYVRAVCSVGDESAWSLSTSFTTPCPAVFTPDYLQDFTSFVPDCWDEATDGDPTTGPTGLGSGSWTSDGFLNDGSSGSARINLYSTFKSDWLLSPSFDLSAGGFEVAFNIGITTYSGTSNSPMGSDDEVQLLYSDDNGATWNNLQTWATGSEPSNAGELVTVDLSSITGTSVQFAFWGTEGTVDDAEDYNIYIDNFEVRTPPSCATPTGLTASSVTANSVQLDWTATTSTETGGYEYVLITDGSTPDATTTPTGSVGTGVTTANPTGLTPVTDYEAYVRAVCSVGDESAWSLSTSFTTPCDVFTPDYLEDFTNFVPDCWDEATDGDPTTGPTGLGSGDWTSDGFLNDGSSGSARVELWNLGTSDWLLSPSFDLSAGGFEVAFNIGITVWNNTDDSLMGSDDEVQLLYSDDNGATWNNLQTWARGSEPSNAGELVTVDLSSITGTSVQFAFWGTEGTVDDAEDYNIYIDNFEVRTPPSCAAPTGLTASNVTATSVQLDWTATTSTETGGYEYVLITDGSTPDATTIPTGSVGTGITTANPTGLTSGTSYDAYVRAVCSVGLESAWSAVESFSTPIVNDDCSGALPATVTAFGNTSQPINFDTTGAQDASVVPSCEGFDSSESDLWYTFTTNATDGVTLSLLSGNEGNIEGAIYDACGGTELFCFADGSSVDFTSDVLVTGLTTNTTYFLQVYTEDYSEGAFSLAITDLPACAEPQNLNVSNVATDSADLNWDDVSNATNGFEWFVFASGDDPATATPVATGIVGVGVTTANVTGLTPQTDYDFYVSSDCDTNGVSSLAGPESFSTLALPPANDNLCDAIALTIGTPSTGDAYTNVGATAQTDEPVASCFDDGINGSVWFTFVAPASGSVEVSTDIAGGTLDDTEIAVYEAPTDCADLTTLGAELGCNQDILFPNFLSAVDLTGLTPSDTYYIQVDQWGTATPGTFGIEVNETLSTETFDSQNFSFYPNPTQNTLNFQTTRQVESVVVYNMLGQQVMTETPNTVSPSLNVEALQAGTYIMNVTIDGSSENFRFIKK